MAVSPTRPDPSSPGEVAAAGFPTARRGFDQAEVRDFLRMVAAELARLQERERHLERELRTAQQRPSSGVTEFDEETATRLLGEEAAHILQAAREGAVAIRARAEDGAARLLREATDEAQRLREEAEVEAARRRQDASADAEAELQMAKQQGREMVNEARAYRERVLSELARRRELARQQIEQLIHGRDRLLQVFERARLVAVDVMADLTPLPEPDEYVNLSPTTGPVPIVVPVDSLRQGADEAGDDDGHPAAGPASEPAEGETASHGESVIYDVAEEETPADDDDVVVAMPQPPEGRSEGGEHSDREPAPVVALFGEEDPLVLDEEEDRTTLDDTTAVESLFARLRAARAESIAERAAAAATADAALAPEPEPRAEPAPETRATAHEQADGTEPEGEQQEPSPFDRREAALVPVISAGARKMKRVLADEQNRVLDTLRRKEPVRTLEVLVPREADHTSAYADAVSVELLTAAVTGAASVSTAPEAEHRVAIEQSGAVGTLREAITSELVAPLRQRLQGCIEQAGDNDELAHAARAVYREWKTQRIDDCLTDIARMAHGAGAFAVIQPGTEIVWQRDPSTAGCPDCEDNSLAGAVAAGDPFPTGHVCVPAHAGCRCMVVPARQ